MTDRCILAQWGTIVVCTSAAKNWAGLVTTRVLLGVFESAVAPSLMLITTMWYKVARNIRLALRRIHLSDINHSDRNNHGA